MKTKRPVRITREPDGSWRVRYADRKPGQRYCAAQFDRRKSDDTPRTVFDVIDWVKAQRKFILVDPL